LVIDAPERNTLGLKGGDVILSVDGRKARGPSSLLRIMSSYEDGDVMKLEILRNKGRQTISSKVDRDED
jgi:S1-C subfamily serine protease